MKGIRHVVSVSGGKDSAATLLLAMLRFPREKIIPIFCDTGNEHQEVYDYLLYLEQALDIEILHLKADLSGAVTAKRMFIARDRRTRREYDTAPVFDAEGNPVQKRDKFGSPVCNRTIGIKARPEAFKRLDVAPVGGFVPTDTLPTDNGITLIKKAELEFNGWIPLQLFGAELCLTTGEATFPEAKIQIRVTGRAKNVESPAFGGIRPANPPAPANLASFLHRDRFSILPFLEHRTAEKVFAFHREHNLQPNPLYRQGMGRVGCMPCINAGKDELRQIAARFPDHIDRIAGWERLVSDASKRGHSTFFHKVDESGKAIDSAIFARNNVQQTVEWSRTTRGGRQFDLLAAAVEPTACSSAYGLCE